MRRWGAAERYLARAVLRAFLLAAAALTVLLGLLGFTDQLASVGQGGYRLRDALEYVLLTTPFTLEQVAPVAMLLGGLLGLGGLAKHSELTAMQGLGISAARIALALARLAFPVILALALLAEFVIPVAEQRAEIVHDRSLTHPASGGFWARDGREYLNVQGLAADGLPQSIDIYEFAADGSLVSAIHARQASLQPRGVWRLADVTERRVTASGFQLAQQASLSWPAFISIGQLRRLLLPPVLMPPSALFLYTSSLRARRQPAIRYANALWAQISVPAALLAMLLVAVPISLGAPRAQNAGRQIGLGGAIGIVFSLSQQVAGYLTLLYGLDPAVSELTPSLVLTALALWMLRRTA